MSRLFSLYQFLLCTFIIMLGREELFLDACTSPVTILLRTHSEISICLTPIAMEVIFVISRPEKLLKVRSILYIHFVSLAWSCPLKPRVKDGRETSRTNLDELLHRNESELSTKRTHFGPSMSKKWTSVLVPHAKLGGCVCTFHQIAYPNYTAMNICYKILAY